MDQIRSARTNRSLRFAVVTLMLLAGGFGALALHPAPVRAQLGISVNVGPPAIPDYEQPPCPTQNDVWQPGYWAYDRDGGYYWVPGTWVPAPAEGLSWTPGYWGWNDSSYRWNQGYWAPQVGYYGGIDYGYGYGGNGYDGGRWQGDRYSYNTAYSNVDRNDVRSVYVDRRGTGNTWDRRSYNGGNGGVTARPTRSQVALARGRRIPATSVQLQHQRIAATNRLSFASANHGRPALAAVARPLAARTAPVHVAAKHVAPVHVAAFRPHVAAVHPATHDAPAHVAASHYAPVHAAVPHYAPVHAAVPHYAPAPRAGPAHAVAPAHAAPPPERHHETH